jgi:hypothetical protein
MKKLILLVMVIGILFIVGCDGTTTVAVDSEVQQAQTTKKIMNEMNNQIGMPDIKEFYEKKMAKEIFELRDNSKLITYAYSQNLNGKFVYIGRCMGFGLPYSTQYTNPEKVDFVDGGEYDALNPYVLPQADPNGLFTSNGVSATWLMLINEETGKPEIMYYEPTIAVHQSKLPRRLVESWSLPSDY